MAYSMALGGVGQRRNLLHSPNTQVQLLTPNKTTCTTLLIGMASVGSQYAPL